MAKGGEKKPRDAAILKTVEAIFDAVVSLRQEFQAEKSQIRAYVDKRMGEAEERIIGRLSPTEKAVDKDSEMLLNHERRIRALEKNAARA